MFGTSSAQGVIEIYGLHTVATSSASHREVYQRSPTVLKAMIQAQDFKYELLLSASVQCLHINLLIRAPSLRFVTADSSIP
jgi:hypothetical protein